MKSKRANRLAGESSPYLLQHAHNPVDWYPWGEEALQKAKEEDKVILVSIGYSACHWCHVMERESFEDPETAGIMNEYFVNIKVDREERPDLDHIYMDAVQAMNGSGGWPLNVFLTPEARPFFGGTYYPPERRYGQPAWKDVLKAVHNAYTDNRDDIIKQADHLTDHISTHPVKALIGNGSESEFFNLTNLETITDNMLKTADAVWGGFGKAPKFLHTFSLRYLMTDYYYSGNRKALDQVVLSLTKMLQGGIFDQLEGGFSRYSTDDKWLVPHFEKMLYDNALMLEAMSEAYQLTGDALFSEGISQTLSFVHSQLTTHDGGFYSAYDADSEGVEGKYYTWTKQEVDEILQDDADLFSKIFDVSIYGNWEEMNILWLPVGLGKWSETLSFPLHPLKEKVNTLKEKLIAAKQSRAKPALDNKIILGWNALMVQACCKVFAATGDELALSMATGNLQYLERHLKQDNTWYHSFAAGQKKQIAFLDDLASLIAAYLLYGEVMGAEIWFEKAEKIAEKVINDFSDEESAFFYYTASEQQDVVVRKIDVYDGATASGNAIMAGNLHKLSVIFDRPEWKERAAGMVAQMADAIRQYPNSFGEWALSWQQLVRGVEEIAVVGKAANDILPQILKMYIPNKIIQILREGESAMPLLKGKTVDAEKNLIYVCRNYSCQQPVQSVEEIKSVLKKQISQ